MTVAGGAASAEEAKAQAALRRSMQTGIVKISSKTSWSPLPAEQTHLQVCPTGVGLTYATSLTRHLTVMY